MTDYDMLKVTHQRGSSPHALFLILEGRLAGPWVEELDVYCRKLSEDARHCTMIDLTGVTFVDAAGKALLACLWRQGAELRASGCLTRCLVEDITKVGRTDSVGPHGDRMAAG